MLSRRVQLLISTKCTSVPHGSDTRAPRVRHPCPTGPTPVVDDVYFRNNVPLQPIGEWIIIVYKTSSSDWFLSSVFHTCHGNRALMVFLFSCRRKIFLLPTAGDLVMLVPFFFKGVLAVITASTYRNSKNENKLFHDGWAATINPILWQGGLILQKMHTYQMQDSRHLYWSFAWYNSSPSSRDLRRSRYSSIHLHIDDGPL